MKENSEANPVVEGCPETWHDAQPTVLKGVDEWIDSGHPGRCMERLKGLDQQDPDRFLIARFRLLSHCIDQHEARIPENLSSTDMIPNLWKESGLLEAVRCKEGTLVPKDVQKLERFVKSESGVMNLCLLAWGIGHERFRSLWKMSWESATISSHQDWMGALLSIAFRRRLCLREAMDRIIGDPKATYRTCGSKLIELLVRSPILTDRREILLRFLLKAYGVPVAKEIVDACRPWRDPPQALVDATRLLLEKDPDSKAAMIGVGSCLEIAPDFAAPVAARWINRQDAGLGSEFISQVKRSDHGPLFAAVAQDALTYSVEHHESLARKPLLMHIQATAVADWIDRNHERDEACFYMAGLLRRYLSSDCEDATRRRMILQAEELHQRYGVRRRERVLQRNHLNQKDTDPGLRAIALAQDVRPKKRDPSVKELIQNIRRLPATHRALGGDRFERLARDRPHDFAMAHQYSLDLDAEASRLAKAHEAGDVSDGGLRWSRRRIALEDSFRSEWEARFARLHDAGYRFRVSDLFSQQDTWDEIMLLDRLRNHFDKVEYQVRLHETRPKVLDFLMRCPEGEILMEFCVIGDKPKDVLEGPRVLNPGGEIKNSLLNKLRYQFHRGQRDYLRPLVVAVQGRNVMYPEWGAGDALYGPLKLSLLLDPHSHDVVGEGVTRDVDRAFFEEPGIECISAVAVFSPAQANGASLEGRLNRPVKEPRHPLSPGLWVRLRTALFGPEPTHFNDRLSAIPTITPDEARRLWEAGIDDVGFFGAGLKEKPAGLQMEEGRFRRLQEESTRLIEILRHQRIGALKAAEGADLRPLWKAGIQTCQQLLAAKAVPEAFPEEVWEAMRKEAWCFMNL